MGETKYPMGDTSGGATHSGNKSCKHLGGRIHTNEVKRAGEASEKQSFVKNIYRGECRALKIR